MWGLVCDGAAFKLGLSAFPAPSDSRTEDCAGHLLVGLQAGLQGSVGGGMI